MIVNNLSIVRLTSVAMICSALLAGGAVLGAAADDGDGGLGVGGTVASMIQINIDDISHSWRRAPHRLDAYVRTLHVGATATQGGAWLTVTDGDYASGRRHGRLRLRALPLMASAGSSFQSLGGRVDPVLLRWRKPMATAPAAIRLLQTARKAVRHAANKRLLITLVAAGP